MRAPIIAAVVTLASTLVPPASAEDEGCGNGWHVEWLPGLLTVLDTTIVAGEVIIPLLPVPLPPPETLALVGNAICESSAPLDPSCVLAGRTESEVLSCVNLGP